MILRPSTRSQSLLRAFVRPQNTSRLSQRRNRCDVPWLGTNNLKGKYFEENGVPGFLNPATYKETWKVYQQDLCDSVNSSIAGGKNENKGPYELHLMYSRNPYHAELYNKAAMLHFNHFWWESLAQEKVSIPAHLQKTIEAQFGSVEDLRIEMLNHANAMFGNGFVWLVKEHHPDYTSGNKEPPLRILCTYNAGSPYQEAHARKQDKDMAHSDPTDLGNTMVGRNNRMNQVQNFVGSHGPLSSTGLLKGNRMGPLFSQPLLCVNMWQHMWVFDYGVSSRGKETYLAAWWESIDWDVVSSRYGMDSKLTELRGGFGRP